MEHQELLNQYLPQQHMMQLATISEGRPWICTVYYVFDEAHNLYWASLPTRRHSRDIEANPDVAAAIAVNYTIGQDVIGLQIEGTAALQAVADYNRRMVERYAEKFLRDEDWVEDFMAGQTQHRLYKLSPTAIFLFDEVNFPGGKKQQIG